MRSRWRSARANKVMLVAIGLMLVVWPTVASAASPLQEAGSAAPVLWPLLLAILFSAFAIERVLELFWNYVEWILLNSGRWTAGNVMSSTYRRFKGGTSVLLGAIFGVLLASLFNLHLFAALQPLTLGFLGAVPANWDVVLTGLVVGVSAKPVHDILGILAGLNHFFAAAAVRQREAAGASMADGVLKLAQSDAQSMVDVPGMGPTRLDTGGFGPEAESGQGAEEQSPTDRYIDLLHERTS